MNSCGMDMKIGYRGMDDYRRKEVKVSNKPNHVETDKEYKNRIRDARRAKETVKRYC